MEIELVQGDVSKIYKFQRKDKSGVITTRPQKMWITIKQNSSCDECLFQKTLDNGIEFDAETNYYKFQFLSDDTCNLPYGEYGFDIAILNEKGQKKTLLKDGVLKIVKHYTHKSNEV